MDKYQHAIKSLPEQQIITADFPVNNRYTPLKARQGGMGLLFFCLDCQTQEHVVLKTLKPETIKNNHLNKYRFTQEISNWILLGSHPNLVQAYRVEMLGQPLQPYLVIEAINGSQIGDDVSLSYIQTLLPKQQLPIRSSLDIILGVTHVMIHAISRIQNFVHRDIKPQNILLDQSGRAHLTDFGLSYSLTDTESNKTSSSEKINPDTVKEYRPAGSPLYIAPELWTPGVMADTSSDIYALGLSLYEMLTGMKCAYGQTLKQVKDVHCSGELTPIPSSMPPPIRYLLEKCSATDKDKRFQSWQELESCLQEVYIEILGVQAPAYQPEEQTTQPLNELVGSYINIATSYQQQGDIKKALKYNIAATQTLKNTENYALIFSGLCQAGALYHQLGKTKAATRCLEKAIAMLNHVIPDIESEPITIDSMMLLSHLYYKDAKTEQALEVMQTAMELAKKHSDSALIAVVSGNIANLHADTGQYELALQGYQEQLKTLRLNKDQLNEAKCLGNIATAQLSLMKTEEALENLKDCLRIAQEIDDVSCQTFALKNTCRAYLIRKDYQQAKQKLTHYLTHVEQWNDQSEIRWVRLKLTQLGLLINGQDNK